MTIEITISAYYLGSCSKCSADMWTEDENVHEVTKPLDPPIPARDGFPAVTAIRWHEHVVCPKRVPR